MKIATKILHTGNEICEVTGAVCPPIHHASTFRQLKADEFGPYDYARSGNPTREALENAIAFLEGGTAGFAFASGMAAISSVFFTFSPGDHLVVCEDVYGGTYRVLTGLLQRFNIEATFVDFTNADSIKAAIKPNTKALYIETPSNPLLKITDLRLVTAIAKAHALLTIVDNTFLTPYLQRPIELGVDIVIHSATKYLGGHSDVLAGLVVVADQGLAAKVKYVQNSVGAVLGPQDCWLIMRGIKTLKARMDLHQQGAMKLAQWLSQCPEVKEVYFPGLPDHPGKEIHDSQSDGPGAIVTFRLKNETIAKKVLESVKIPVFAVSLGAVESIISYPITMSHAGMSLEHRLKVGVTGELIRYSVGLEDPDDLINDLQTAIRNAQI